MVTIPTFDRQVDLPSSTGATLTTPEDFGANVARQIEGSFDRGRDRANKLNLLKKDTEFKEELRGIEASYSNLRGEDALGLTAERNKEVAKAKSRYMDGIPPAYRLQGESNYVSASERHLTKTSTYESQQFEVFDAQTRELAEEELYTATTQRVLGDIGGLEIADADMNNNIYNNDPVKAKEATQELYQQQVDIWKAEDAEGTKQLIEDNKVLFQNKVGGEFDEMMKGVEQAIRFEEVDARNAATKIKEEIEKNQEKTRNNFLVSNSDNTLTSQEVLVSDLPAFGSGSKDTFLKMLEAKAKLAEKGEEFESDPNAVIDWTKIAHHSALTDPNAPIDQIGILFTQKDAEHIKQVQLDSEKPGMGILARAIDDGQGIILKGNFLTGQTAKDKIRARDFELELTRTVMEGIEEGLTVENMLTDPTSKDYVFGKTLNGFVPTTQEAFQEQVSLLQDEPLIETVPPRNPNESIEDYLLRTGNDNK